MSATTAASRVSIVAAAASPIASLMPPIPTMKASASAGAPAR